MKPDSRPLPTPEQFAAVWQLLVVKGRQWLAERQAEERESEGNGYEQRGASNKILGESDR